MTLDELTEQQNREHAEMIERLMHQEPPLLRFMDADEQRNQFTRLTLTALAKVRHGRAYAVDLQTARELSAFGLAFRDNVLESGGRFDDRELTRCLDELSQIDNLNLRKKLPLDEIELKPILDPITALPIKNPWSDPLDLTSQMALERDHPHLAKYYRESKNGSSYSMVAKMREEREQRDRIRAVGKEYGPKHHTPENNPFLLPHGKEALAKQSAFAKAHEHEPWLIEFYKREASEPVTLNFGNLTTRSMITKRDPILGKIFERAMEIHKQWLKDDIERLSQLTGESAAQIEAARKQLATAR